MSVCVCVCVCVCSCLSCPAWKSHLLCLLLCCHLWPVWLYHIFLHYLINGTIFGENLLNIKYILIFCTTFVRNNSHSKKYLARHCHKPIGLRINCLFVILVRFYLNLIFFRSVFEKSSNIKCRENLSSGSRVFPYGQTDLTKLIVIFHNSTSARRLCFLNRRLAEALSSPWRYS